MHRLELLFKQCVQLGFYLGALPLRRFVICVESVALTQVAEIIIVILNMFSMVKVTLEGDSWDAASKSPGEEQLSILMFQRVCALEKLLMVDLLVFFREVF